MWQRLEAARAAKLESRLKRGGGSVLIGGRKGASKQWRVGGKKIDPMMQHMLETMMDEVNSKNAAENASSSSLSSLASSSELATSSAFKPIVESWPHSSVAPQSLPSSFLFAHAFPQNSTDPDYQPAFAFSSSSSSSSLESSSLESSQSKFPFKKKSAAATATVFTPPSTLSSSSSSSSSNWSSVGGLDAHVSLLRESVMLPLLYPEVYARFHARPPRGVIL
jgi:SpoVK/Ycf46/Vps4 family AAA+-type ATPase